MIGIYKITSPSGRIYIGQSRNIKNRIKGYRNGNHKSQLKLSRSIKKYGWSNHLFEVIEECEIEDLNKLEIYWISSFDCLGLNGLNIKGGGYNGCHSASTRVKMSLSAKGRKMSPETKQKLSIINLGRKMSEEAKTKMRIAATGNKNFSYRKKRQYRG